MSRGTLDSGHSHAALDAGTRHAKARKIEAVLGLDATSGPLRLLEVGTGSGWIAHYFGAHPSGRYTVEAVDVVDSRQVREGFGYRDVDGTTLPFPDQSFDVVLSNHVIEHVGAGAEQLAHLRELRRVLRPGGVGYLAVPNRWMLVEPHYRLAFLSWLPRFLRSPYLRAAGKGTAYDCEPLRLPELERLLAAADLPAHNAGNDALRALVRIEPAASPLARGLAALPDVALWPLRRVIPTLIYTFSRPAP